LWFLPFDHANLTNALFHSDKTFNNNGVFDQQEIDGLVDAKLRDEKLPLLQFPYIANVLARFFSSTETPSPADVEVQLINGYYNYLASVPNLFVSKYAGFDKNLRNLFAALNGQKYGLPFDNQLIGDDPSLEMLRKGRWRDYGISADVGNIESLLALFEMQDVLDRELKIDMLRWQFIEDAIVFEPFSIDRVMAYLLKLMIVDRWVKLDHDMGKTLFAKFLKDVENSGINDDELKISHGINQ